MSHNQDSTTETTTRTVELWEDNGGGLVVAHGGRAYSHETEPTKGGFATDALSLVDGDGEWPDEAQLDGDWQDTRTLIATWTSGGGVELVKSAAGRAGERYLGIDGDGTSQAHQVAAALGDGQTWETSDGREMADLLEAAGARRRPYTDTLPIRHELPDGSAIIEGDGGWDVGFPSTDDDDRYGCTCWAGACDADQCADGCSCGCHAAPERD